MKSSVSLCRCYEIFRKTRLDFQDWKDFRKNVVFVVGFVFVKMTFFAATRPIKSFSRITGTRGGVENSESK